MTALRLVFVCAATIWLGTAAALAQTTPARPPGVPAPGVNDSRILIAPNGQVTVPAPRIIESGYRYRRPVWRIGQDYTVHATDVVREIVAVSGTVTIEGRVDGDVVVSLGNVRLGPAALVHGSVVVVGGDVIAAQGAEIRDDLVIVGGALDAPASFSARGQHLTIGTPPFGAWLRNVVPWFSHGLLWGRLIVPGLPWVWSMVVVFFLISLALNLIFDRPVRACAEVVTERPLSALIVGMVMLVLLAPIFLILAATMIGLVVIPFIACALAVAWMIGRVGIARGIGASLVRQGEPDSRAQGVRSFVIGFALIVLAYTVPVLGIVTWAMVGVFGLGAATITFLTALRRESPKASKTPPPAASPTEPMPPAPPTPPSGYEPAPVMSAVDLSGSSLGADPYSSGVRQSALPDEVPPGGPQPQSAAAVAGAAMAGGVVRPAIAFATFLDRVAAFVLDCLLIAVADQILHLRLGDSQFFVLLLAYHVAFWTWMGTTMGGIIVGIKIVRTTGGDVRFVDALVRGLASLFSIAALGIGCLWMLQDPDRQTWHDKLAGTFVVKAPRHLLLA